MPASVAASSAARPLARLAVVGCSTKAAVAHLLVHQQRPGPAVAPQPPLQHRPAGNALDGEPGPLGDRPRAQSPGEARQVTRSSPSAPSAQRQAAATDSEADPPPRACPAVQEPTSGPATPAQPLRAGHHVSRPAPRRTHRPPAPSRPATPPTPTAARRCACRATARSSSTAPCRPGRRRARPGRRPVPRGRRTRWPVVMPVGSICRRCQGTSYRRQPFPSCAPPTMRVRRGRPAAG